MSLWQSHRWGARYNAQFSFEAFNIFNTPRCNEPGRSLGGRNFGVISSPGAPRSQQVGFQFAF